MSPRRYAKHDGMIPEFYKRFFGDARSKMPNVASATDLPANLNDLHPNLDQLLVLLCSYRSTTKFHWMASNRKEWIKRRNSKVYRKSTNAGLRKVIQTEVNMEGP